MKPRAVLTAACTGLAVALSACTSSTRSRPVRRRAAGRHGAVITVGSFDFPESVLLAEIYGAGARGGQLPGTDPAEPGPAASWSIRR